MREFNYELKQLCQRNRDGSDGTRADRERILDLIANQLQEMGYKHMHATSLKAKHVKTLVARWHAEQIASGTIKNRMAQLRWLAEKNGTPKIIARSNDAYAQERYRELTGWECPANGGPKSKQLTPAQKEIDREARMTITHELGHGREPVTAQYIGR